MQIQWKHRREKPGWKITTILDGKSWGVTWWTEMESGIHIYHYQPRTEALFSNFTRWCKIALCEKKMQKVFNFQKEHKDQDLHNLVWHQPLQRYHLLLIHTLAHRNSQWTTIFLLDLMLSWLSIFMLIVRRHHLCFLAEFLIRCVG
jgi:hypothetical protein